MRLVRLASIIPWLAGACGDSPEEPPRVELFTQHVGCADVYFGAEPPVGGTAYLAADTPGLLAQARAAGATVTTTFTLPDERVRLEVVTGRMLRRPCDDTPWIQQVDAVYHPTGGTARFTVGPEGPPDAGLGRGTLELQGVTLESERGGVVEIDRFVIGPVSLGWLPG